MKKPVVIAASWRPATGFTRVVREIARGLAQDYEVHYLGLAYKGEVRTQDNFVLHPSNLRGGDVFGAWGTGELIDELGADTLVAINDFWILENYERIIVPRRDRLRSIAYIPVDGTIHAAMKVDHLHCFDELVSYTQFGRNELVARLGDDPPVHIIPHGMDLRAFTPWPKGRADARQLALPPGEDWQRGFVVLNANRPVPRKRIDLTIRGFAMFAADKPANVKLVLHHAIAMPEELSDLEKMLERSGLGDRVWVSANRQLDDEQLNALYNSCDVGLNTASGEGWGLVSFEHAAACAAQVVPDNSACTELWEGAAELLPTTPNPMPDFAMLGMQDVRPEDVADALQRLYEDPEHCADVAVRCLRRAADPTLAWPRIQRQWRDLVGGTDVRNDRRAGAVNSA